MQGHFDRLMHVWEPHSLRSYHIDFQSRYWWARTTTRFKVAGRFSTGLTAVWWKQISKRLWFQILVLGVNFMNARRCKHIHLELTHLVIFNLLTLNPFFNAIKLVINKFVILQIVFHLTFILPFLLSQKIKVLSLNFMKLFNDHSYSSHYFRNPPLAFR